MSDTDEDSEVSFRATALCSSEEPDVVIVVGGKEFHEYRQSLRCWSAFFDAAFRSGMKESKTQRFEFPDKDPKEWELVASLASPMSADRVTMDNVYKLLPWFDHLESMRGLEECDSLLHTQAERALKLISEESIGNKTRSDVANAELQSCLTDIMPTSLEYNLQKSLRQCIIIVQNVLSHHAHILSLDDLKRIVSLMATHEVCRTEICRYLPSAPSMEHKICSLVFQESFPHYLHAEIKRQAAKRKFRQFEIKLTHLVHHSKNELLRNDLRAAIASFKNEPSSP